jgi:Arm DNA-binding domain/Phage integrase, N-terminal SAM-like domain
VHKAKLTDLSIHALKPPEKGHTVAWDTVITGFGVRVSQGGTKSFFLMHGRQRQRYQIGRVGIITLQDARAAAKKFLAEKTLGKRDNPTIRFEEALALFLETQAERLKTSTKRDYTRILHSHFEKPLRGKPLTEIQTHHITAIIDKLHKTPTEANYTFSVARRFFRWAVSRRYISHSPLEGLGLPTRTASRDRVLSLNEIKRSLEQIARRQFRQNNPSLHYPRPETRGNCRPSFFMD